MDTLATLARERDQLFARARAVLEADVRVNAAWLSGSYGRGEADAWSDLDLHVAVADEHFEEFLAEPDALFAHCGQHVLTFGGFRSNAMPGGRFWLVQYVPYMLEIDWNIGPTSAAIRPEASVILFDRVGLAVSLPALPIEREALMKEATHQLAFFWAMVPLAYKHAGRGHTRLAVEHVRHLQEALVILWRVVWNPRGLSKDTFHQNRPLEAELDAYLPRFGSHIDPLDALRVIRAYCDAVVALHPALADLGASVSDVALREVAAVGRIAEVSVLAGGSGPDIGSRR